MSAFVSSLLRSFGYDSSSSRLSNPHARDICLAKLCDRVRRRARRGLRG